MVLPLARLPLLQHLMAGGIAVTGVRVRGRENSTRQEDRAGKGLYFYSSLSPTDLWRETGTVHNCSTSLKSFVLCLFTFPTSLLDPGNCLSVLSPSKFAFPRVLHSWDHTAFILSDWFLSFHNMHLDLFFAF